MIEKEMLFYKVYEVSPEHRKYGKLLKTFRTKRAAEKFAEKSIYRYIKIVKSIEIDLTLNEMEVKLEEAEKKRDEAFIILELYATAIENIKRRAMAYQNKVEKLTGAMNALKELKVK